MLQATTIIRLGSSPGLTCVLPTDRDYLDCQAWLAPLPQLVRHWRAVLLASPSEPLGPPGTWCHAD